MAQLIDELELEFERRVKQTPNEMASQSPAVPTSPPMPAAARTDEVDAATTLISKPSLSSIVKPRRWPTIALIALIVAGLSFGAYKLWTRSREVTPPVAANIARVTSPCSWLTALVDPDDRIASAVMLNCMPLPLS